MRTNVVLDDNLIKEAIKCSGIKTKKELINKAIQNFVENCKCKDLRKLKGKIHFIEYYNYKTLRKGS
ncbi:MAG: type II toxin-antitoxin system VapB family antitoxin [Candidatus Omnitrophica bacterium]|jgi:Arc/MetJ family transcription regulator|nr:type II toxin-antitoxin system VapB family antitoxin [Candidatus Omnitrophota bacterium]